MYRIPVLDRIRISVFKDTDWYGTFHTNLLFTAGCCSYLGVRVNVYGPCSAGDLGLFHDADLGLFHDADSCSDAVVLRHLGSVGDHHLA